MYRWFLFNIQIKTWWINLMEHKFWESCWVSIYTGSTQNVVTPQVCISMKFENLLSCDWYLWGIWLYIFQLGWWVNLWQRPPPSFRFSRRTSRLSLGLRVSHRERETGEKRERNIGEKKLSKKYSHTKRVNECLIWDMKEKSD